MYELLRNVDNFGFKLLTGVYPSFQMSDDDNLSRWDAVLDGPADDDQASNPGTVRRP